METLRDDSAAKFINALIKSVQTLCHGYLDFQNGVEIIGHINLSVDKGSSLDYILKEKVCKNAENSTLFISNSFHAEPKPEPEVPGKPPQSGNQVSLNTEASTETDKVSSVISSISSALTELKEITQRSSSNAKDSNSSHSQPNAAKRKASEDESTEVRPAKVSYHDQLSHVTSELSYPAGSSSPIDSREAPQALTSESSYPAGSSIPIDSREALQALRAANDDMSERVLPQTHRLRTDSFADVGFSLAGSVLKAVGDDQSSRGCDPPVQEIVGIGSGPTMTVIKEEYVEEEGPACSILSSGGQQQEVKEEYVEGKGSPCNILNSGGQQQECDLYQQGSSLMQTVNELCTTEDKVLAQYLSHAGQPVFTFQLSDSHCEEMQTETGFSSVHTSHDEENYTMMTSIEDDLCKSVHSLDWPSKDATLSKGAALSVSDNTKCSCNESIMWTRTSTGDKLSEGQECRLQQSEAECLEKVKNSGSDDLQDCKVQLDKLLSADGLYRQDVSPGGDSLFEASVVHFQGMTPTNLRISLYDHIVKNFNMYMPLVVQDTQDENERYRIFRLKVQELCCPGGWSREASDLLPQVLADWSEQSVRIYTSSNTIPVSVRDFHPVNRSESRTGQQKADVVPLAFIDSNPSHYDACSKISQLPSGPSTSNRVLTREDGAEGNRQPRKRGKTTKRKERCLTPQTDNTEERTEQQTSPELSNPVDGAGFTSTNQDSLKVPVKKKQKREADPAKWKKNVRKFLRVHGQEYVSQRGKIIPAKKLKALSCSNCRYNCNRISEESRQELFRSFYSLGSYALQKDFVSSSVRQKGTRTLLDANNEVVQKKRTLHNAFYVVVDGQELRVCKKFFLTTFALGSGFVGHALRNSSNGVYTGTERRGHHTPHNKVNSETVRQVKEHMERFLGLQSPYSQDDVQSLCLQCKPKMTKMYDDHVKQCQEQGVKPVSLNVYRRIFRDKFLPHFRK